MEFRVLGPLEAWSHGRQLALGGTKRRAVLALLLLNANEVVPTDRLIEALWGEDPPGGATKALQVHISGLRKALEPGRDSNSGWQTIVTKPAGYGAQLDPGELDSARFEELAAEGRAALEAGAPGRAAAKLRQALALWRGPPLADLAYEPALSSAVARLEDARLAAIEDRLDADLALGRHADVAAQVEELLAANPTRERLWCQLMLALYRSGRQAEALEAYRDARRSMVDTLGIEPGRELQRMHQAVLEQDEALDRAHSGGAADGGAAPDRGIFVGREAELSELTATVDRTLGGEGGVVLIGGEPGIGKSRLAEEVCAHARNEGAEVLWGRCWEAGGAPAFWPWIQPFRAYFAERDPETLRAQLGPGARNLAHVFPELAELLPELRTGERRNENEGARFVLFDAITEFLRGAARAQPLVLVLDDLHAGDEPSLLLLEFVARAIGSSRVLVIANYRDTEVARGGRLRRTLAELMREPTTLRLSLSGLARGDIERFIEVAEHVTPSPVLVGALHDQTEGNPLFVAELVKLLAAEGGLPGGEDAPALPAVSIPETVREVIWRRIERLPEPCRDILGIASVIGREFSLAVLGGAAGDRQDRVLEVLDEALEAGVVTEVPGAPLRRRFSHALIRDTLYARMPASRRCRLHRTVAEVIDSLYGGDGDHAAELAHHYIAALPVVDLSRAIAYARRAGERAASQLAFEEAARHYEVALRSVEEAGESDDELRCDLLLEAGDAWARAGATERAKDVFRRAAVMARIGMPERLARAALGYGGRFVWARSTTDPEFLPLLDAAFDQLDDGPSPLRARLLARLAGALRVGSARPGVSAAAAKEYSSALGREAVEVARVVGDPSALAYALEGDLIAMWGPGNARERIALADEIIRLSEQTGEREREFAGYEHGAHSAWELCDFERLESDIPVLERLAADLRQPAQFWLLGTMQTMLLLCRGEYDLAAREMESTFEYGMRSQSWNAELAYCFHGFLLRRATGGLAEFEPDFRRAVDTHPTYVVTRCALADLLALTGDHAVARAELEILAADDFALLPSDEDWLLGMCVLAEVCATLGDTVRAREVYARLRPYESLYGIGQPDGTMGAVAHWLGVLAALDGRGDDATAHFEVALEIERRLRAVPWVAETERAIEKQRASHGAGRTLRR